jgi:hypothetical protein
MIDDSKANLFNLDRILLPDYIKGGKNGIRGLFLAH